MTPHHIQPGSQASNMPRILIVDDVPSNIKFLHQLLRGIYRISVATSGPDAIDIIKKDPPDLILLDIVMPDMDGYEVCRRLKALEGTERIPIIFVTGKGGTKDEQKGLELGAVDYITKPISPAITLARIKTHLALKQARDHLEQLVAERTLQLQRKVKELEARDRLVRFRMQSRNVESSGLEILRVISEVIDTDGLRLFFPGSSERVLAYGAGHGRPQDEADATDVLKTEIAIQLVRDTFSEKALKSGETNLMASPILYHEDILGVVLIAVSGSATESKDEVAGTLWRMANEAAMVLRMTQLSSPKI